MVKKRENDSLQPLKSMLDEYARNVPVEPHKNLALAILRGEGYEEFCQHLDEMLLDITEARKNNIDSDVTYAKSVAWLELEEANAHRLLQKNIAYRKHQHQNSLLGVRIGKAAQSEDPPQIIERQLRAIIESMRQNPDRGDAWEKRVLKTAQRAVTRSSGK